MSQIVCADTRIFTFHLSDVASFTVRAIVDDRGEPWFVAADVCAALGVSNSRDALARLDEDEKGVGLIDTPGGRQQMSVVNESGLYSLILSSRKPEAKPFKKWVTSEVLPSLRKTGKYAMPSAQAPVELTRMDILRLAMDAEEARIKAESERDEAIRTKALIGSKREATAMATAAAAKREVAKLKDALGVNSRHATVTAVEKATKQKFEWLPLKRWCTAHAVEPEVVPDERYGVVKAWPADAWGEIYGIVLSDLFGH